MSLQTELKMNLPIPLDQKQKAEIGQRMSEVELLINEKEGIKKSITAKYSEEIKDLESELYGLAKQFQNNAVNKETECRVDFNSPETGKKTIIRLDTNETVKVYDMSPEEIKALEEPSLFDQSPDESDSEYYTKLYGFDPLRIFTEEELKDNCFQVTDRESLFSRGILDNNFEDSIEDVVEDLRDCLGIKTSQVNIEAIQTDDIQHSFTAESEDEEIAWYFFKPIIQEAVNVQAADEAPDSENDNDDNNEYKIPENVEDGSNEG